jgi:hypothetical protein
LVRLHTFVSSANILQLVQSSRSSEAPDKKILFLIQ